VNEVQVGDGTVYVDYQHKNGNDFRMAIGNRAFDLTKDVRFRIRVDQGEAEVAVLKGEMEVQGRNGELARVKKNETFTLDLNDGAKYTLAKGITALPTDDYEQQRTEYLEQYAKNQNNSPYAYGYSDMNRYGSFFNAPGYGLVWQPASVGMGWDPYSNGYWSLYPGQGYVWVSSYPWGWTPYRYGQWMFLSGNGWVWRPGGWNQWNTGVSVVNPPPTWHQPVPPTQGSGPVVPVGKPIPPTRRTIETEDLNPHRVDRINPVAANGEEQHSRTGSPAKGMTANPQTPATSNVAPTAPTTMPMAPTTVQTRPAEPSRPEHEPRMTKGEREYNMNAERPQRAQAPQPTPAPQPSKSMAPQMSAPPASAPPARTMAPPPSAPPPASRPAPESRPAPSKSSGNNFQSRSGGGFHDGGGVPHIGGGVPHAASANHATHAK
jgi:mannose-6-phosphate isomerase-like protein (cupin superfamily)